MVLTRRAGRAESLLQFCKLLLYRLDRLEERVVRTVAVGIDLLLVFHRLEGVEDDGNEQVDDDEDGHEHEAAEIDPGPRVRIEHRTRISTQPSSVSIWNSVRSAGPSAPQRAGSVSRKK